MKSKIIYRFAIAVVAFAALAGAGCSREDNAPAYPPQTPDEGSAEGTAPNSAEDQPTESQPYGDNTSADATPLSTGSEEALEITMLAKKWEFTPKTITVKKGQKVRLNISSVDVDHGFSLPAFNVDKRLTAGQSTTVEFTPTFAGTFPFTCTVYCGSGHGDMRGELVVTE